MLKRIKNVINKVLVIVIILSLLSIYMPMFLTISSAADDTIILDTPTNLRWKDKSTATATWDVVDNANYYLINVVVYDEEDMIGIQETGTSSNEIDLQQEIYTILQSRNLDAYQITFNVCAKYISDYEVINSEFSDYCELLYVNKKSGIKLATPTDVSIDDNKIARWTNVPEAGLYQVEYLIKYNNTTKTYTDLFIWKSDGIVKNGIFEIDLTNSINNAYKYFEYSNENVEISIKVLSRASALDNVYINSDYSNMSNTITYSQYITKLATPTNISIDDNQIARWTDIPEAGLYQVEYSLKYNNSTRTYIDSLIEKSDGIVKNGIFEINLANSINNAYKFLGYSNEIIEVSFRVLSKASAGDNNHSNSDYSNMSNTITYSQNVTKLTTPTNVSIDDNKIARWTDIPEAGLYKVEYSIKYNNITQTYNNLFIWKRYGIVKDGIFEIDLTNGINSAYNFLGYDNETVEITLRVVAQASAGDNIHIDSDFSKSSNSIYYNPNGSTVIDNITLSPNRPVIAVGRSLYIGKTISPDNALYDKIHWSSSDNSIVSISDMGQITGLKKGNATITAQINNASQNAEVSVYEIESNIDDLEESKEVINEANDTIEAIITNGDISNTDITDKEQVVNEIEQGAENGDMFNVDIKYDEKTPTEYDNIKDKINSEFNGYNIAGGNDIKIAISHTDSNGDEHHIANITELENKVSVKFEIPANIPEVSKNKIREYKLLRCHDENIEAIDFQINNGIVESSSNQFSDFILLYKDVDIPTFEINGTITSYGDNTDNILIQLYNKANGEIIFEKNVIGNNINYTIQDVAAGNYIIKFIKDNHVAREYEIELENSNITQDAKIYLIGDINADGKVNIKDWNKLYDHINETNILTGYEFLCADTNVDGKVNNKDWNRLYEHINEENPLY